MKYKQELKIFIGQCLKQKITSFAIVSLAVGGFAKVNCQDEKEKNHPNHLQQTDLARTIYIEENHTRHLQKANLARTISIEVHQR